MVEIRFLHKYARFPLRDKVKRTAVLGAEPGQLPAEMYCISVMSQRREMQGLTLDRLEVLYLAVGFKTSGGSPVGAEVEYKQV